jgi:hypothetical protein
VAGLLGVRRVARRAERPSQPVPRPPGKLFRRAWRTSLATGVDKLSAAAAGAHVTHPRVDVDWTRPAGDRRLGIGRLGSPGVPGGLGGQTLGDRAHRVALEGLPEGRDE